MKLALQAANAFSPMSDRERDAALTSMRDEEVIFPLAEKAFR
jgi:hypothetical protein